jgi:hypothetical protein
MEGSASAFIDRREVSIEANIDNQSKIVIVYFKYCNKKHWSLPLSGILGACTIKLFTAVIVAIS